MGWSRNGSSVDILKGKRIALIGSSSIDPDRTGTNYMEVIAQRTGIVLVDYSDSGSRTTSDTEDYTVNATNQIKRIDELPSTGIDAVIIQPCANDMNNAKPIGTFASTTPTEVYGALHIAYKKLIDKFPTQPIGVLTSQYFDNNTSQTDQYYDVVKEMSAYYNLPLLDLRTQGRVPYAYPNWQSTYASDGMHLNDAGNVVMSYPVESFLRTLFGQ
jgi:lysophospholipase L1-like esterase